MKEIEIVKLIALEKTTDEISNSLFVSKNTIETHRKNIFFKLNVKNVAGLIIKAEYLGYLKKE
jgi:DNA-binding CsgD family transcriptional regulator